MMTNHSPEPWKVEPSDEQVAELLKKAPDCDIILYQETLDDLAKENLS